MPSGPVHYTPRVEPGVTKVSRCDGEPQEAARCGDQGGRPCADLFQYLGMMRVEAAGEGAIGGEDEFGLAGDIAAARDVAALHVEAQLGVEVP